MYRMSYIYAFLQYDLLFMYKLAILALSQYSADVYYAMCDDTCICSLEDHKNEMCQELAISETYIFITHVI